MKAANYAGQPMSHKAFLAKIECSEEAARKGEVTDHERVKKLIATWSNR